MDLVPSGYLSLREAFDRFRYRLWKGEDPVADLHSAVAGVGTPEALRTCAEVETIADDINKAFVKALSKGRLRVVARDPKSRGFISISPREVSLALFPERLLMTEKIALGHSRYLDGLVGRTVIVPEEQFATFAETILSELGVTEAVRRFVEVLRLPIAEALPDAERTDLLQRLSPSSLGDGKIRKRSKRPGKRAAVAAKLKVQYPQGPEGVSDQTLIEELKKALPKLKSISLSTLQRAKSDAFGPQSN